LLQNNEIVLPRLDDLLFDLSSARDVFVLEIFSQKKQEISKLLNFNDIKRLVICNNEVDKELVEDRK
jgi:hypothetical protein